MKKKNTFHKATTEGKDIDNTSSGDHSRGLRRREIFQLLLNECLMILKAVFLVFILLVLVVLCKPQSTGQIRSEFSKIFFLFSYKFLIAFSKYQEALERAIEEEARGVPPPPASPTADSIVTEGVSILRKEMLPCQYICQFCPYNFQYHKIYINKFYFFISFYLILVLQ